MVCTNHGASVKPLTPDTLLAAAEAAGAILTTHGCGAESFMAGQFDPVLRLKHADFIRVFAGREVRRTRNSYETTLEIKVDGVRVQCAEPRDVSTQAVSETIVLAAVPA